MPKAGDRFRGSISRKALRRSFSFPRDRAGALIIAHASGDKATFCQGRVSTLFCGKERCRSFLLCDFYHISLSLGIFV